MACKSLDEGFGEGKVPVDALGAFRFTGPVGRYELTPLGKDGRPHPGYTPRQITLSAEPDSE